ncbi:hypothetical protein E2C01_027407 [Portunus trituberculatus]|uniref:Uncharacterized protein n=1 Tax=Portunus trituberculatus TaxID=210409 RepID=A0A5B7ELV3_PORTR|nr:hypothetical protein [Portunus trituberculatus]
MEQRRLIRASCPLAAARLSLRASLGVCGTDTKLSEAPNTSGLATLSDAQRGHTFYLHYFCVMHLVGRWYFGGLLPF